MYLLLRIPTQGHFGLPLTLHQRPHVHLSILGPNSYFLPDNIWSSVGIAPRKWILFLFPLPYSSHPFEKFSSFY